MTRVPSHRNSRCKDSSAFISCCLWKHLSHFINTPLSLPFSGTFTKNQVSEIQHWLEAPSHGDKCSRAIPILCSSCSVCFSKGSVQSKQPNSRTSQIIRIFSQVCEYFKTDIFTSTMHYSEIPG